VTDQLSLSGKYWNVPAVCDSIGGFMAKRLAHIGAAHNRAWDDATVFPDAIKAVARVREGIARQEKIAIFGDYDCDGVTASAQLLRCLQRHGADPVLRLPHRVHDGYGLREKHIDEFADTGITLLITVDTGISAHDALRHAKERGIDVIILDHHHWTTIPDAFAILHPGLAENFPEPHPAAAGVAFLFVHAMEGATWAERDIDLTLALFGTVADLVPMGGFNRRLVQEGLQALRRLPDGPLKQLVDAVGKGKPLTSIDIAFRIAPRINAAGRMADPMLALRALLEGGAPLKELESLNISRQEETVRCIDDAIRQIAPDGNTSHDHLPAFLSVADPSYAPGIVGLIAGKLTERFGRPSMAVHINGDLCTASLRSPACYNIVEGLERVSGLLTDFGGHAQAAGCSFPLQNLGSITDAMEADIRERVAPALLVPALHIDAVIDAKAITTHTILSLQELEPYGQGNAEPHFLVRNATMMNARRVGADGKHLQAMVGNSKLIGFGMGEWDLYANEELDLICRLGIDTWNGRMVPQLFLVDARLKVGEVADVAKGTDVGR
jgi:single-stranded-DNA-specific exonuclease